MTEDQTPKERPSLRREKEDWEYLFEVVILYAPLATLLILYVAYRNLDVASTGMVAAYFLVWAGFVIKTVWLDKGDATVQREGHAGASPGVVAREERVAVDERYLGPNDCPHCGASPCLPLWRKAFLGLGPRSRARCQECDLRVAVDIPGWLLWPCCPPWR